MNSTVPLANARQSGTHIGADCTPEECAADKAVDENLLTESRTSESHNPWWSVELTEPSMIYRILVHISPHAHQEGEFKRFKVETRMRETDDWSICKGEYSVAPPLDPHEVRCDDTTTAKYLKLSAENENEMTQLRLKEVAVQRLGNLS